VCGRVGVWESRWVNNNGGCSIVRRSNIPKVRGFGLGLGLEMYLVGLSD